MARCAGVNDWKDGQPTDTNPTYGGLHYEEGRGWCTRSGDSIKMSSEPYTPSPRRPAHPSGNPNIPYGYQRVAMGIPCPIPGSEDGVCVYSVNGKRAIWDDGNVYMAKE